MMNVFACLRVVLGLLVALVLSGCASVVDTRVTVFQKLDLNVPRTYAFERSAAQAQSLEHAAYEELVKRALAGVGFEERQQNPSYRITLAYDANYQREQRVEFVPEPLGPRLIWSRGWGMGMHPWGPGFGPGSRLGFGAGFYRERVVDVIVARLRIEIKDARDGSNRYEVTVLGNSNQALTPAEAMPALVKAAFDGFPRASGSTRTIRVTLDDHR